MTAVETLLGRISSLEELLTMIGGPIYQKTRGIEGFTQTNLPDHPAFRDAVLRGAAIVELQAIEQFMYQRSKEWESRIAQAGIHTRTEAIKSLHQRMIFLLTKSEHRFPNPYDDSTIAESVVSALDPARPVKISALAFHWNGSNLSIEDIKNIVSILFGKNAGGADIIQKVTAALLTDMGNLNQNQWGSIKSPDLGRMLNDLSEQRHSAAHNDIPKADLHSIQIELQQVTLVCLALDITLSLGVKALCHPNFLVLDKNAIQKVSIQIISPNQSRSKQPFRVNSPVKLGYFPKREHQKKAKALLNDMNEAREASSTFVDASSPKGMNISLVVDENYKIQDWRIS